MRAGDLVAVRLEIINEALAEAKLLAQRLLAAGGAKILGLAVGRQAGIKIILVVVGEAAGVSSGGVSCERGRTVDEALVQAEFAGITDRGDNAGALAVLFAVDGETCLDLGDRGAAVLQPVGSAVSSSVKASASTSSSSARRSSIRWHSCASSGSPSTRSGARR